MLGIADIKFRKKKKLGSYPYFSVVFSNTIALFVIGLFALLLLQSKKLSDIIRNNIEVQIYLDKQISESNISRLRNILSNSNYILKENDIPQIRFISDEEAAQNFIVNTGEDFTEFLGDNPLHDTFVIKIKPEYQDINSLNEIKIDVERLQGVYEVIYMESLITSINKNTAKISLILVGIMVVMLLIVLVLINNTIKLALFSQRFLIRSMQLVGAKSSFIQWPFLRRSIIHGFISGVLASIILYNILLYANKKIEGLSDLQNNIELILVFISISVLGGVIGFFSTFHSVRKYLKMSLDELY
jgi:cell division transport system permease protein